MIGIIGAMQVEVELLTGRLENKSREIISGISFYRGTLCGREAVVAKCGEGKVSSAVCAEAMILKYCPEIIINTGVAGGIGKGVNVLDIVVADRVVQHDMDITPLGHAPGYSPAIDCVFIDCCRSEAEKIAAVANEINDDINVHTGVIASGDQFISDDAGAAYISKTFNAAAVEMEGAGIGAVCFMNGVDFVVVRAISDGGDRDAGLTFQEFVNIAAERSAALVMDYIGRYGSVL